MLTPVVAVHGSDLRSIESRLEKNTAIARSTGKRQEGIGRVSESDVCSTAVALKGVCDPGVMCSIWVSAIEHFQQVEATSVMELRLQCMDRGQSRWSAQDL